MTDPKLTPREPTPEMVDAGFGYCVLPSDVWRAMHDAAPTVEAEPVARMLVWCGPPGYPTLPAAARTYAEFPETEALPYKADAYWRNDAPLYTHPAAPQPAAPVLAAEPWSVTVALNEDATRLLQSTMVPEPGEVSEISLHIGHGHEGYGLYVSLTEYPEEGSIHLACIAAPQPAALPENMDIAATAIAYDMGYDTNGRAVFPNRDRLCQFVRHMIAADRAQPAALPELSDAEIGRLVDRMDNTHDSDLLKFARAVIAAMKGKQ